MKEEEIAFLATSKLDPVSASGDLALSYSSHTPHGRAVRKDPDTYEEAVQQLEEHNAEVAEKCEEEEVEPQEQVRVANEGRVWFTSFRLDVCMSFC